MRDRGRGWWSFTRRPTWSGPWTGWTEQSLMEGRLRSERWEPEDQADVTELDQGVQEAGPGRIQGQNPEVEAEEAGAEADHKNGN